MIQHNPVQHTPIIYIMYMAAMALEFVNPNLGQFLHFKDEENEGWGIES